MTAAVLVLFVSAYGVAGRVYCALGEIHWYVTALTVSSMWSLDPHNKVLGTDWVLSLA